MSDTNLSPVKRALLEIKDLQAKLHEVQSAQKEPIAIIGAGLRFPGGVNDLDSYWQLLAHGVDAVTDIPKNRWDIEMFYDPDPETPGKMYTRKGGFLDHVDQFDAHFFGISPREALSMDPQQRLLLQIGWEALENAGQAPDKLNGSLTGVFIGVSNNDYGRLLFTEFQEIDLHYATGNAFSVVPGRLSYLLGLQGPSIAVDTACSSSLVAIHLACQSLRSRESNLALAGGVNIILTPEMNINFSKAKMMAFDDKCKTFDAAADGYVRGEGCAVIVLKRLSDALANNDNILAIIKGSAVNQDGRSSGLTAPNGPSQEAVIRNALVNARVEPVQVNYLEAHGTGTSLGDPIEVQALGAVLREGRSQDNPLMIGSVKTNLGHLEAAAGIAGLLKVVLALQHQEIPPHLHLQKLSPYIPWQNLSVIVPTETTPWQKNGAPRIGNVSAFGFSGTNAHIVLQEAPELPHAQDHDAASKKERPVQILTLSAKRAEALNELIARYDTFLTEAQVDFRNLCFTSKVGRAHLPHRVAVISRSVTDAREKLEAFAAGKEVPDVISGHAANGDQPEVTFLFTGHGAHYINMGRQLYETCPSFRADLEECSELLKPYLDKPLLSVLYPSDDRLDAEMGAMTYTQPALFALQYALARLWKRWGIEPTFVMGHSAGEYTAACIAGVFSLADGLKLVAARGRLMDSISQAGKMVTVFADEARVVAAVAPFADYVSIAAVNGPRHLVISGAIPAIDSVIAALESDNIKLRQLDIAQAAHSPVMDSILDEYESILAEINFSSPQIGLVSTLTGQLVSDTELTDPRYWRRHLRESVRFAAAMKTLQHEGQRIFVEIGPQPTLLSMGKRCLPELEDTGLWLPSLRKDRKDWQEMLESLGVLYANGATIDWVEFERPYSGRLITLPTYPWAKESYWRVPSSIASRSMPSSREAGSSWETIISSGRQQAQQAPLDFAMHSYEAKWDILDRLTIGYIIRVLQDLDIFTRPDESHTLETITRQAGTLDRYSGLLSRWLQRLAANGFLVQEADRFTSPEPLPAISLETLRTEASTILADNMSHIMDYVERCGAKIIPIITGKENPLETLFPEGSYTTVDYLYNGWTLIRYFNGILRAIVESLAKQFFIHKKIRILEIGAGTGGSTAALLPSLPVDRTEYHFTDMSDFFLVRAQEKFKDYSFIQYGILNIEKDTKSQGYSSHSYDLVIAANALHATQNLEQTISNARELLAPGGFLLILEGTNYLSWFDITTSLIEGWERFDDGIRGDTPLLPATQWQEVLQSNGFEKAAAFPEDRSLSQLFAHNIIAAQVPEEANGSETWEPDAAHAQTRSSKAEMASGTTDAEFLKNLTNALPDDRQELLTNHVREQVAKILRLEASYPLGRKDRLMDLGLDSLMAVELRSRLNKGLKPKRALSATLVFDYPTIESIAKYLEIELFGSEASDAVTEPTSSVDADRTQGEQKIMALSEEEIEALLLKKFEDEQ